MSPQAHSNLNASVMLPTPNKGQLLFYLLFPPRVKTNKKNNKVKFTSFFFKVIRKFKIEKWIFRNHLKPAALSLRLSCWFWQPGRTRYSYGYPSQYRTVLVKDVLKSLVCEKRFEVIKL